MNKGHLRRRCPKPLKGKCESARCGHSYEYRFSHDGRVWTGSKDEKGQPLSTERAARSAMTVAMGKAAKGELLTKREQRQAKAAAVAAAEAAAREAESRIRTGAYLDQWLDRRGNIRPSTRLGYRVIIDSHVKPVIGEIPLQDLTRHDVRAVLERMAEPGQDGRTRTVGTLARARSLLTGALKVALREDLVAVNVAAGVEIPERAAVGHATGRKATLTAEQARTFLELADVTPFGPVLRFTSRTGLRRGEAVGLRWDDVDLDEAVAHIRRSLTVTQGQVSEAGPKTEAGMRFVGLDCVTVALLREVKRAQAQQALVLGAGYRFNPGGFVFTRPDGAHLRPDSITQAARRIADAMGLAEIHLHSLRHTRGTTFLEAGIDIKIVSDQLGHSDVAFTQRTYQHVSTKLAKDAARTAAALLDQVEADSVASPVANPGASNG